MSTKYPGGLITKSPVVPSGPTGTNTAPGIWTLEQAAYYQKLGQWPGLALDPYFNNVSMLLHGDGTNGAQNNTFLDSSTNNFTITRNGNTTQGTFTPFSQAAGYWGNYFDGAGDFLQPSSGNWSNLSTGNFTIECWVHLDSNSAIQLITDARGGSGLTPWQFYTSATGKLVFFYGSTLTGSTTISANAWNHVAVVRSGSTITLYVNGVADGTASSSANLNGGATTYIGRVFDTGTTVYYKGYISNFRAVIGTAVYTTAFTPSTVPLTAITNTSLLTCQSNRFVDNSTNNFTLTANGNVAVQPFSPFRPTSAYSTAVNGGSGYFNNTNDYLSLSSSAGAFRTSNFTVEAWVFSTQTQSGSGGYFFCGSTTAFVLGMIGDKVNCGYSLVAYTYTGVISIPNNTWTHICAVRNGSTTFVYVNGVLDGSFADTRDYNPTISYVGGITNSYNFIGYVSNLRAVNGTAVYTAAFTPPTAPVTAITNTSLLTNFTNAGIFDNAMKNDIETVGNAQISTAVVKYGTGSMAFDGTTDYLNIRNTPVSTVFGTGSWTIEGWCYSTAINSAYKTLYANGYPVQIYQRNSTIEVYISSSAGSAVYIISALTGPVSGITINTWAHFALVKNGSTYTVYINGVAGTAATSATAIPFSSSVNAGMGDLVEFGSLAFTGYIDDFRITNGVARYTANFTPPTAAFPNQ